MLLTVLEGDAVCVRGTERGEESPGNAGAREASVHSYIRTLGVCFYDKEKFPKK